MTPFSPFTAASDLDGNGLCNLEEFLILNRNIEAENYIEDILTSIFKENADAVVDGESNLTFDKFAVVCVDFNMFSDEAQDAFIGVRHKKDIEIKFEELRTVWPNRLKEYRSRIAALSQFDASQKEKWSEIATALDTRITNHQNTELKPLLIAERILDKEIELLESGGEEIMLINEEEGEEAAATAEALPVVLFQK